MEAVALLAFVTLQRLAELALARRNTARLLARGAYEVAAEHYPLIVALHAAWLGGLWLAAPGRPLVTAWLALFVILQILRLWVLASLRERWTTRIIVLPNAPLVRTGPYRFVSHPNYVVVAAEIAVLPLCFDLPGYALVFFILNGIVLAVRIRREAAALRVAAAVALIAFAALASGPTQAKPARCTTTDDGSYPCNFVATERDGSFVISARGKPTYILVMIEPGVAGGFLNLGGRNVALPGPLVRDPRDPACWTNDSATFQICAR